MAGAGRKWLTGCGIGCGLMVLILGGMGTCGYRVAKNIKQRADRLEADTDSLNTRFGVASAFVPAPDGAVPADRMEAFLAVRDDMSPSRAAMSEMLTVLDGEGGWIAKSRAGLKLVPSVMDFAAERNRALMAHGMGEGEYLYIYSLAYFDLLGVDPGDGPGFVLSSDDHNEEDGVKIDWGARHNSKAAHEKRVRRVRHFVNGVMTPVLEHQLAAVKDALPAGADPAADPWASRLGAEVEAMKLETLRLPWEDGLPDRIRASLEPYRDRLKSTYDPIVAVVEIGLNDEE